MSRAKQAAYAAQANGHTTSTSTSASSGASFASGFLLGQLTLAFILFLFIKFFIFGEPPSADSRAATRAALRRQRTLSHSSSLRRRSASDLRKKRSTGTLRPIVTGSGGVLTTDQILEKTYYNVDGHQPESLDWFNVLIAQTIAQIRADALEGDAVLDSLSSALNSPARPSFLGEIKVTEISLGEEFPIFSNCRVIPVDEEGHVVKSSMGTRAGSLGPKSGGRGNTRGGDKRGGGAGSGIGGAGAGIGVGESRLQARMDVDLSDVVTLGIETKLVLNYPKPFSAVLPIALAVSVVRFSGTLSLSFTPSQTPPAAGSKDATASSVNGDSDDGSNASRNPTTLTFTFLDDYRLDLSVHSLIGSRSRLQDVPKIAQLIEQRIHAWFDERCVEPRFQQILLPSLWPRKRNVRGGGDDDATQKDGSVLETPSSSPPPHKAASEQSKSTGCDGADKERNHANRDSTHDWVHSHGSPSAQRTPRRPAFPRSKPSELAVDDDGLEAAGAAMREAEERDRRSRERSRLGPRPPNGPRRRPTSELRRTGSKGPGIH